jgi:hypothetical protein
LDSKTEHALALAAILFRANCARQLSRRAVQDRLGLSDTQRDQVGRLADRVADAQGELRRRPVAELPDLLRDYEPTAKDLEAIIEAALTEEQRDALHRLVLQEIRGPMVLLAPNVIQHLQLDSGQTAAVAELVWNDFERAKSASLWELPGLRQRAVETRRRAEAVLTDSQRQLLTDLVRPDAE